MHIRHVGDDIGKTGGGTGTRKLLFPRPGHRGGGFGGNVRSGFERVFLKFDLRWWFLAPTDRPRDRRRPWTILKVILHTTSPLLTGVTSLSLSPYCLPTRPSLAVRPLEYTPLNTAPLPSTRKPDFFFFFLIPVGRGRKKQQRQQHRTPHFRKHVHSQQGTTIRRRKKRTTTTTKKPNKSQQEEEVFSVERNKNNPWPVQNPPTTPPPPPPPAYHLTTPIPS